MRIFPLVLLILALGCVWHIAAQEHQSTTRFYANSQVAFGRNQNGYLIHDRNHGDICVLVIEIISSGWGAARAVSTELWPCQ